LFLYFPFPSFQVFEHYFFLEFYYNFSSVGFLAIPLCVIFSGYSRDYASLSLHNLRSFDILPPYADHKASWYRAIHHSPSGLYAIVICSSSTYTINNTK
jgi:hypothetical protein